MHSRVPSVRKGDAMKLGNAYNIRTATNVLQRNPSLFKPLVNLTLIVFVVFVMLIGATYFFDGPQVEAKRQRLDAQQHATFIATCKAGDTRRTSYGDFGGEFCPKTKEAK